MESTSKTLTVTHVDDLPPVIVAPGITRYSLPTTSAATAWIIDFAPGSQWPAVDHHDTEERYYVLSGEVVEGDRRIGAGSYVIFAAGSEHKPRSVVGARILGTNAGPATDHDSSELLP